MGSFISYSLYDIFEQVEVLQMWKSYESDEGYTFGKIRMGKLHIYKSGANHVAWIIQNLYRKNAHFLTKLLEFVTIFIKFWIFRI